MKRFYTSVAVVREATGWRITLDGRPIRTVGGAAQILPTRALAEAMAEEWAAQGAEIDAQTFRLRDTADYALDVISRDRAAAMRDILRFAETDTLCYRGDPEDALHARQILMWEPILTAAETRHGIRFERISGVIHRPQPTETLARLHEALTALDLFTLAATQAMGSLAASLVIALAALEPAANLAALWDAASLEEEWQADLWGREAEAEARRARRRADFLSAARFATLARDMSDQPWPDTPWAEGREIPTHH